MVKKVLVTGGNGFVGSHIVEELLFNDYKPICLVRKNSDKRWISNFNVEYRYGDLTDIQSLVEAVKDCDAVIHSAGVLRANNVQTYYDGNQIGTRNLIDALLKYNPYILKFIYISSQAAIGPSVNDVPKRFEEPETPISDYGSSKLAGEKELKVLKGKIPYTILRPAAVYGPRDKDIFIFFNLVDMHVRVMPLTERKLQLLFVKDLSKVAVDALSNKKSDFRTYFLAEPRPYTWNEIGNTISESIESFTLPLPLPDFVFNIVAFFAELVSKFTGKPAVLNSQKIKEMTQKYWIADAEPARRDFQIDFTKLKFGAKITNSWYKENNWL